MRAAVVERLGGPESVVVRDIEDPRPGTDDVLIEVHAAGVIFPDVLKSRGAYQDKPELPYVVGHQVSGIVVSAPTGSGFGAGDRVAALTERGAFAEWTLTDAGRVFPLPTQLSFAQGAVAPVNYLTTHFAYTARANLQVEETVLVHGAAGGLGSVGVQFARAIGARVIAVTSTPAKADVAREAGAHDVIGVEGFRDTVRDLTGGRGVDVVFDPVGGDRFTDSLRCLTVLGRLLVLGFAGGEIPTVKVNRLLLNNIDVIGIAWGEYWTTRVGYPHEQWAAILPLFASGELRPLVGSTYPLSEAAIALGSLSGRQATGNVVVVVR